MGKLCFDTKYIQKTFHHTLVGCELIADKISEQSENNLCVCKVKVAIHTILTQPVKVPEVQLPACNAAALGQLSGISGYRTEKKV